MTVPKCRKTRQGSLSASRACSGCVVVVWIPLFHYPQWLLHVFGPRFSSRVAGERLRELCSPVLISSSGSFKLQALGCAWKCNIKASMRRRAKQLKLLFLPAPSILCCAILSLRANMQRGHISGLPEFGGKKKASFTLRGQ